MKNKFITTVSALLVVAVSAIAITGCNINKTENVADTTKYIKTAVVGVDSLEVSETFSGIVKELDDVKLSFRISGPIAEVSVKEGQYVKKGQQLVLMDKRDYQLQYNAVEAEYQKTVGEIERLEKLHANKSLTDNDYEKAMAGKRQITAKFESAKNSLADTRLVAPFDGYVQTLFVSSNETVAAGMPVVSLVNMNGFIVESDIPAGTYIKKDMFAHYTCRLHNFPDQDFSASLIGIAPKPSRSNLYTMQLHLASRPGNNIAPGMSTMVSIFYKSDVAGSPIVPLSSCINENGSTFVWLFNQADSTVSKHEVELGTVDLHNNVKVVSGLSGGEIIVTAGVHSVKEGVTYKLLTEN